MATSHYNTVTLVDYSNEKSTVSVYNGSITALTIAAFLTQVSALRTSIEGITKGVVVGTSWVGDKDTLAAVPPTDVFAQRELKWLVRYENVVSHNIYTMEIPTADPTARLLPASDKADLADTEIAAFVTAFEAIARSPENDVDGVSVLDITLVGRNL